MRREQVRCFAIAHGCDFPPSWSFFCHSRRPGPAPRGAFSTFPFYLARRPPIASTTFRHFIPVSGPCPPRRARPSPSSRPRDPALPAPPRPPRDVDRAARRHRFAESGRKTCLSDHAYAAVTATAHRPFPAIWCFEVDTPPFASVYSPATDQASFSRVEIGAHAVVPDDSHAGYCIRQSSLFEPGRRM